MTIEEINSSSVEELRSKCIELFGNKASIDVYLGFEAQISDLAKQFGEIKIDVESDDSDKLFKRLMEFSKRVKEMEKDQLARRQELDEGLLIEERNKRIAAKRGTLEGFINERDGVI